jgi:hypothetical protein
MYSLVGLKTLIQQAKHTLLIAGMYISLSEGTSNPSLGKNMINK